MEALELLLGLAAFVVALGAPVLALVAYLRTRKLAGLERRVHLLERELDRLHAEGPEPAAAATPPHPSASPPSTRRAVPPPVPVQPRPVPPAGPPRPAPARPAPAPRPASSARPPAEPPRPRIEWERWVGVRGAALASGLVIAIAGILFFRHAVEQGWVRPELRVGTGLLAGLAAIGGAELLRRRAFRFAPAALAGAGTVLLYASLWAAHRLYELLPVVPTLLSMSAVTLACGALSVRHAAQAVAGIGILGGFATPLVLQTSEPSALGLFGYVLLLDLGLIALSRRRRWPLLAALGLLGTFGIQLSWFARHLDVESLPVTLVALGLIGLVFAAALPAGERADGTSTLVRAAALLLPFGFVLHLAARADLGERLYPLALVAAPLLAGAAWTARRQTIAWLPGAAAAGVVALVGVWAARTPLDAKSAWELAASSVGLSLASALFALRCADDDRRASIRLGALVASGGLLVTLCAAATAAPRGLPPAPLAAGLAATALVLARLGGEGLWRLAPPAAGALLGYGLTRLVLEADPELFPGAPPTWRSAALLLGGAALLHAQAWVGAARTRRHGWRAAAAFALPALALLPGGPMFQHAEPLVALGTALLFGLSTAAAATALGGGGWLVAATLLTGYAQTSWIQAEVRGARFEPERIAELAPLLLSLGSALFFVALPLVSARLRASRAAWRAAALAPPAWFLGLAPLFGQRVGERWSAVLPLALAGALAFVLASARRRAPLAEPSDPARRVATVWLGAFACLFASWAVADQLGHYEARIAAALFGAGALALWRRVPHLGLQLWGALGLLAAAAGVLEGLGVAGYYHRGPFPIWSWTSYAHLVPAACFALAAVLLRDGEVARAPASLAPLYRSGRPWLSGLTGLLAALTVFAWINLSIFDLFGEGERIVIELARDERRDLALSIAWIAYALALLALGMVRRIGGLRWLSLAFLVLALGKVFLRDLGELEGLYRVFSMLGLGLSLLAVSLLYQRFVFPRERGSRADEDPLAEPG